MSICWQAHPDESTIFTRLNSCLHFSLAYVIVILSFIGLTAGGAQRLRGILKPTLGT
jgi:hypothetical protein